MKQYKEIWNNLSQTRDDAAYYVCCVKDEEAIRQNGYHTAEFLKSVLQLSLTDTVLEIGCGIGRVGRELAKHCREWKGADISGQMLSYAAERTRGIENVSLHELPANNLSLFADNSFDAVYSTIVFMHLDKPDMFRYIREGYRVLKPGGRAYFDTYNLLAPDAWAEFQKIVSLFASADLPGHVSQFSTPQEMQKFMEEAGFSAIEVMGEDRQLVTAIGIRLE